MLKAYQYRLYPSNVQERKLEATRETCRRWYNDLLSERKTAYEERGATIGKYAQLRRVKDHKAASPWAKVVHSHVLQVVVSDLDTAFQAFFRRLKAGQTPGYPRLRVFHRFDSFGFKEYGNGFKLDGRRLRVTGIGRIAVRWHRQIEGRIKTLRLIKKAGKWFASFAVEYEPTALPATGKDVGVDVGIASLLTTSDGDKTPTQGWYRNEQAKLRVLQRRVARRTKGGKNRRKAVALLQRQHERIENRRKDFLNKQAHTLIAQYDRIAVEDLKITNMVQNRHLAKSIMDAGWGYFVARLHAKAEEAGRVVVEVNPAYTSKDCSRCGYRFEDLTLKDRWIDCPRCGLSLDRDHNAARNILKRGGQLRWGISSSVDGLLQEAAGL
ncbi:MAG: IS200/IS605 family element transposase accessory protein TnpB [Herpetosiphonaceae bacterium]|nr:IS200/IS605 family element transposase accessory protein TnpB [Herpetosiphonaceae bacterium]